MERIKDAAAIAAYAKENGISELKLDKAIALNSMPSKGKFIGFSVKTVTIGGEERKYLALHCEDGSTVSVNTIQALTHLGSKETLKLKKVTKEGSAMLGKYFISGKPVNPQLSGDQSNVIANLLDKSFKTQIVQGYAIPFGKNTEEEDTTRALVDTKDYYKVEVL